VALTPRGAEFVDRFRELNARQMRELLAVLDDADLVSVRDALAALARAAVRLATSDRSAPERASSVQRKDPA
jgi:molybdenum-dependent DNA-binding transcriptional regulator ModE